MANPTDIAAALRKARSYGGRFAAGGAVHEGFLHSPVPGRTDKLPISVSGGAYVLPADHVAALGQGNSLSGADIVNKMFKQGPYGTSRVPLRGRRAPRQKRFAEGGATAEPVDVLAAGGEIVLPPDAIMARFGNLKKGHKALKKWVLDTRQKHIETLRGLEPPK